MQPQGHVQILLNLFEFGMGLQEAGDAPRVRHAGSSTPTGKAADPSGGEVLLEAGITSDVVRELLKRGHAVTSTYGSFGGYQAIWYDGANDVYYGATESRKDGIALVY